MPGLYMRHRSDGVKDTRELLRTELHINYLFLPPFTVTNENLKCSYSLRLYECGWYVGVMGGGLDVYPLAPTPGRIGAHPQRTLQTKFCFSPQHLTHSDYETLAVVHDLL